MSVSSDDLLALAIELVGGDGECRARTSVGRSYYALFHQAVATAESLNLQNCPSDKKMATHERLIYRYENGGKGLAAIGRSLRKQKQLRAVADYDIREEFRVEEARLHLANSTRIIKDLVRIAKPEVASEA